MDYESLLEHFGHKIEVVVYGDLMKPTNVAVECETCNQVLFDFDRPDDDKELENE
jgi:predicted dithiol-disulfide oxidoreductase (DUF899 family)